MNMLLLDTSVMKRPIRVKLGTNILEVLISNITCAQYLMNLLPKSLHWLAYLARINKDLIKDIGVVRLIDDCCWFMV